MVSRCNLGTADGVRCIALKCSAKSQIGQTHFPCGAGTRTPLAELIRRLQHGADRAAMVASVVAISACYVAIIIGGAIILARFLASQRA